MASWTTALPYFKAPELMCKGSSILVLDRRLAVALPYLRHTWRKPLVLNSACRSADHNARVGGHVNSLHLAYNRKHATFGAMAVDVRWHAWHWHQQLDFARLAWRLGWSVGLHDEYTHIDRRAEIGLPPTVFLYPGWSGFDLEAVTE